ncbi:MAG: GntR family transcriptional regulator [Chelatococcus sp.]|jgi:DNA-binding GntR family transcriptional regulator|uniref:GntR family transcriptional regulator n=1 Tax=unclassified Chelatococcus TaxID=2638111 RepID=UPI001BCC53F0|nr:MULTISPECIES: GntR family transcriptional regulator [unclassified Chelatococcus]CAH1672078.1 DNA-binding GntR family transcriptional regulator [Hyphomicrobiales bacterium]MBS7738995.1 GntR family transcriptional regulator [Chelatococcus sp. HY11]MBX3541011.1 GntR family transcriptional regulator [Chelatococcus sp.]MBX3543428.1 GntR family transcriptional regulator [Chelatococcus sp.]MCO5076475.1 GntR family transcriptional regulator [Chelatococcus sp.]
MTDLTTSPVEPATDSLAEIAYRRIEEMIVTRELLPGSMISENQLADELDCGRTPIREALQRLKLEGFVEIHPRRGALVTPVDVMRQLELLEVRRPLEDLVARLAAERATPDERREMLRLADEITAAAERGDQRAYLSANRAIHDIRTKASRNTMLTRTMGLVLGLSRRFWYAYIQDTGSFTVAAALHNDILQAIAAGSASDAATAVSKLLDFLESLTRRAIERQL